MLHAKGLCGAQRFGDSPHAPRWVIDEIAIEPFHHQFIEFLDRLNAAKLVFKEDKYLPNMVKTCLSFNL
jgi:hypothetical protein